MISLANVPVLNPFESEADPEDRHEFGVGPAASRSSALSTSEAGRVSSAGPCLSSPTLTGASVTAPNTQQDQVNASVKKQPVHQSSRKTTTSERPERIPRRTAAPSDGSTRVSELLPGLNSFVFPKRRADMIRGEEARRLLQEIQEIRLIDERPPQELPLTLPKEFSSTAHIMASCIASVLNEVAVDLKRYESLPVGKQVDDEQGDYNQTRIRSITCFLGDYDAAVLTLGTRASSIIESIRDMAGVDPSSLLQLDEDGLVELGEAMVAYEKSITAALREFSEAVCIIERLIKRCENLWMAFEIEHTRAELDSKPTLPETVVGIAAGTIIPRWGGAALELAGAVTGQISNTTGSNGVQWMRFGKESISGMAEGVIPRLKSSVRKWFRVRFMEKTFNQSVRATRELARHAQEFTRIMGTNTVKLGKTIMLLAYFWDCRKRAVETMRVQIGEVLTNLSRPDGEARLSVVEVLLAEVEVHLAETRNSLQCFRYESCQLRGILLQYAFPRSDPSGHLHTVFHGRL